MNITESLTQWYAQHKRPLPWREAPTPYLVWLSEIILQQTRVAQGTAYFLRFAEKFKTVHHLAAADVNEVLKLWEGLGYYSRARNLHTAAQQVVTDFRGEFPKTFESLRKLKGVGPYTAAAIASICFGEKTAVVDGNVYRVLARLHGIDTPINSTAGIKQFQNLANTYMNQVTDAGTWNQTLMEFGALHCVPKTPNCMRCPVAYACIAYQTGQVAKLPVKQKAKPVRHRFLHYFIAADDAHIWVTQRNTADIWGGLYQFPLLETDAPVNQPKKLAEFIGADKEFKKLAGPIVHLLSHQKLHITFWETDVLAPTLQANATQISRSKLERLAFPIVLKRFIEANLLHLPPSAD